MWKILIAAHYRSPKLAYAKATLFAIKHYWWFSRRRRTAFKFWGWTRFESDDEVSNFPPWLSTSRQSLAPLDETSDRLGFARQTLFFQRLTPVASSLAQVAIKYCTYLLGYRDDVRNQISVWFTHGSGLSVVRRLWG